MWLRYQIHRHGGKAIRACWTGFCGASRPRKPLNILPILQNCHKESVDACWQLLTHMRMKQMGLEPKQSLRLWPFVLLSKLAQEATQNTMSLCYIGNWNLHWHSGASNLISCSGVWSDNLVKKWKQCCLSKCFHHGWPFQIWKSKPPARECRQLARRPEHANVQMRLLKDD